MNKDVATVLDIQRLSTEDGPGVRTTVFFKGCSLACKWCHNPESLVMKKQLQWISVGRCIGCRSCLKACKTGALSFESEGLRIDREKCVACGACVNACPTNALEMEGHDWQLDDLVYEVAKDIAYFGKDGGVTISGGESLLQNSFVTAFLAKLKEKGIGTAIDTAGCVPNEFIDRVLPYTDIILYDLKLIDTKEHKLHTGQDNEITLDNVKYVADYIRANGYPNMWIRTPIIPGATNTKYNIRGIGRFIADNIEDCIQKWELCAFNNLCRDKYDRLDMDWDYKDSSLLTRTEMEEIYEEAKSSGVNPGIVEWSGSTKLEK